MLKSAAVFLIALSAACGGWIYSSALSVRVRKIEKILLFISEIKTEIEFTSDSLKNILDSISAHGNFTLLPFIGDCVHRMRNGEDFFNAWKGSVLKRENVYALKKGDTALLISFGASLGRTDSAGQIRNCELHEKLFKDKLSSAQEEKKTLSRPARGIGFMAAAALLIIFL